MKTGGEFEGIDGYLLMYQGRLAEVRATVEHVKVDHFPLSVSRGDRGDQGDRHGPGSRPRSDG